MPRPLCRLALGVFLLIGCNAKAPVKPKAVAKLPGTSSSNKSSPQATPDATATAPTPPTDPFKLLKDKPSPDLFTASFKRALTGQDGGSANWNAGLYAREVADKLTTEAPVRAGTLYLAPAGQERLLARVITTPEGPRFDWLQLVPAGPPVSPAELPATFAAAGFLGALTADRYSLATELLSPAARARLAPPRSEADKAVGYAPGILKLRLNSFRARASGFTLGPVADLNAVPATLTGGNPRPVTLKLVRVGEEFRVEDFAAR